MCVGKVSAVKTAVFVVVVMATMTLVYLAKDGIGYDGY